MAEAFDDPVELALAEVRSTAVAGCAADAAGAGTCAWYHEGWAALRALGVVTTPAHHHAFYATRLAALARRTRAPRVLVCGTADHAMPAVALAACVGADLRLDVLDRCDTPLALTRWYARRQGFGRLETLRANALDLEAHDRYDAICTHSFLGYFDAGARERLARRWAAALRGGGRVLLVNRIRPADSPPVVMFSPEQARALRARAAAALRSRPILEAGTLDALVEAYADGCRFHAVRSEAELVEPLEAGGLRVETLQVSGVAGSEHARASGPTTPGGARYAMVEALAA